jgi:hypothetical protein
MIIEKENNFPIYEGANLIIKERKDGALSEKDRLSAAKQILGVLSVIFVLTEILYFLHPEQGAPFLDIAKIIIPPLATLIVAFYFKEKSNNN